MPNGIRGSWLVMALVLLGAAPPLAAQSEAGDPAAASTPLVVGETFTIESLVLGETRRINVYAPPAWDEAPGARRPVLYMPDGGIGEDFLHVAGLLQVSVMNGTMRPFLLVGIENTQRRRDLTGPTANAEDRRIAPDVGGSAAFRAFIRTELMPAVRARYPTTDETAIVGESLAGLFIVETFFLEPDLFDTYIAFDPSLWWNDEALLGRAGERLRSGALGANTLYLANSSQPELAELGRRLADILAASPGSGVRWQYEELPRETHMTIYHPAALQAFRRLFPPVAHGD